MKTTLLRLCFWLLLWVGPARAGLETGEEIAPGVTLLHSGMGAWHELEDGTTRFVPGPVLTLKPGEHFGWRFRVRSGLDELKVRVAITLPQPPKEWAWNGEVVDKQQSSDGLMKISEDRRTATVEVERAIVDGWLTDPWTFAAGDPYGPHEMRIYVGNRLVRVFHFTVVEPKPGDKK